MSIDTSHTQLTAEQESHTAVEPSNAVVSTQVRPAKAKRRTFSKSYKQKILLAYDACESSSERGALLRREGIYHSRISCWRRQLGEVQSTSSLKPKRSKASIHNQQLSRENARLRKQLAQAEAVIDLQKKVSELLGTHILPVEQSE